jgi:hypothetical protein
MARARSCRQKWYHFCMTKEHTHIGLKNCMKLEKCSAMSGKSSNVLLRHVLRQPNAIF